MLKTKDEKDIIDVIIDVVKVRVSESLENNCGKRTIQANTGMFRSLKYNGATIEQAIEKAIRVEETPFGILGYSQVAANGPTVESMLISGSLPYPQ